MVNNLEDIKIAYFSAEIGLNQEIKTYAGGLGILAGDYLKTCADTNYPICGITLLYKKGFFKQEISSEFEQIEKVDSWDYKKYLKDTNTVVKVNLDSRDVYIKAWIYWLEGEKSKIPILFLDTDLEQNNEEDKKITSQLYFNNRLKQEIVLGIGGFRVLEAMNIKPNKYHMNEGHSSFLTLELYRTIGEKEGYDDQKVKHKCVFTTHTPIPAGHDIYDYNYFTNMLKDECENLIPWHLKDLAGENMLNTTRLAMSLSNSINAVAHRHLEVTQNMFPDKIDKIDYVTNGVHIPTWTNQYFAKLYDKLGNWKLDENVFLNVHDLDNQEILNAKKDSKRELIEFINKNSFNEVNFDEEILTIGFARRFIHYKNAEMIFQKINRLKKLGKKLQFVFAGKSHMSDGIAKTIITRILENTQLLKEDVNIAFLENYNIDVAKKLVSGCDIWLNTPIPPNEASGTSGMKASANGTIHFSTLDGWSFESFEKGFGGFPITDVESFYNLLEYKIIPMYYYNKENWVIEMKSSIKNASFFNTLRMLKEYDDKFYNKF